MNYDETIEDVIRRMANYDWTITSNGLVRASDSRGHLYCPITCGHGPPNDYWYVADRLGYDQQAVADIVRAADGVIKWEYLAPLRDRLLRAAGFRRNEQE